MRTVMVSGGFDPLHPGHVDLFEAARKLGDRLIVAVNSNEWLIKKKGYIFMTRACRATMVLALRDVDGVACGWRDDDGTACEALWQVRPQVFANGGDRDTPNEYEDYVCRLLHVEQVFGVGGEKTWSSSGLVASACDARGRR